MAGYNMNEYFTRQWVSISKSCIERMERQDRRTIRGFRNFDDVLNYAVLEQDEVFPEAALQELSMLQPRLVDLQNLSGFFAKKLGPDLDPGAFWGLLGLFLTVALQHDEAMRRVSQMIKKLSRNCHYFHAHTQQSATPSSAEKETCFEMFISITKFFTNAVEFLREVGDMSLLSQARGHHQQYSWQRLTDIFTASESDVEESLNRIEKLATISRNSSDEVASWLSFLSLSPRTFTDTAQLPCFILPPARTARFFDRDDVIEKIEQHFANRTAGGLRSLALYGMGGVGKSHVALKYVEREQSNKGFDAIFWIQAETSVAIQQSFTEVALRLRLPDARTDSHGDNRRTVLAWLQKTSSKWLIIYDNVDEFSLLRDYWPVLGSQGSALITTRNYSLAFDPADAGLEVSPWDAETGSQFLLHLLSGHISAELLANEAKSAYGLAQRLSGHALALSNMGGLIHRQSWTISELLTFYDSAKEFKDGLEAVWQLSFQNLRPDSAALLAIFCFCAPDSLPQALFDLGDVEHLPDSLLWYTDENRLSEAMEDLLTLALIKRDRYTRTFSIHRLIQTHFLRFMAVEDRQKSFCDASVLMYNVFPKKPDNTKAMLYDVWDRCQMWMQHVLHLKSSFVAERRRNPNFYACTETCATWVQCQRFLLESQNWTELEDLVTVDKIALGTLPSQDPELYMLSATETHVAQMWARQGRYRIALESMLTARDIKLSAPQVDLQNVSWTEDNTSVFHGCMGELDAALEWNARSRDTWQRWSTAAGVEFQWPAPQRLAFGRNLSYAGRFDEARAELERALREFRVQQPLIWGMAAACKYSLGRLSMFEGNYEVAGGAFVEAQNIWLQGDKSRTSDFNGAAMYRIGCCCLLQGDVDAALKHLQDAMTVTSIHKETMVGEHARCLFKMSEALYQVPGREVDADKLLKEAEDMYWKRVGRPKTTGDSRGGVEGQEDRPVAEVDYDSLVFLLWR